MEEVTRIIDAVQRGDQEAAGRLLEVAYAELRRIAAHKMAGQRAGHTLQPTALVHEAYLRLLGPDGEQPRWNTRGHFFFAAAEAMRRILIENARRRMAIKRGGDRERVTWDEEAFETEVPSEEILAVHEALASLEEAHPELARVALLRYFAGMSLEETASAMDTSVSSVQRLWRAARAWLHRELSNQGEP